MNVASKFYLEYLKFHKKAEQKDKMTKAESKKSAISKSELFCNI